MKPKKKDRRKEPQPQELCLPKPEAGTGFKLIPYFLILAISLIAVKNFFLEGGSIYHINSVASSPLLFIKLQMDNFRNFAFQPQYWTRLCYTGGPVHTGLGLLNPLFLPAALFKQFSHSLLFYEVLLKALSGIGILVLMRRYGFSLLASTAGALLYPLNPFGGAFGQDPQMTAGLYLLPFLLLGMERLFDSYRQVSQGIVSSICCAFLLSVIYLASNIQVFVFLLAFVIAPYLAIRTLGIVWKQDEPFQFSHIYLKENRFAHLVGFLALAFILNSLMVLFELVPTRNVIQTGSRMVVFDHKIILYMLLITIIAAVIHFKRNKVVPVAALVLMLTALMFHPKTGLPCDPFETYVKSTVASEFIFDSQPLRYYCTLFQFVFLAIAVFSRPKTSDRKLILFHIAIAYFAVNTLFLLNSVTRGVPFWEVLGKPAIYALPDYYYRCAFVPFIGIAVGIPWALETIFKPSGTRRGMARYSALIVVALLCGDTVHAYFKRTLFTDGLAFITRECEEYDFLKTIAPTERVISVYDNEHKTWGRSFQTEIAPKWLIPPYFNANTYSRVGISIIPKRNEIYHSLAMPLYFGLDAKRPLNRLLDLAGVKYIFSYKALAPASDLTLLKKGKEYFIYENKGVLPRILLCPSARKPKKNVMFPFESEGGVQLQQVEGAETILCEMIKQGRQELLDGVYMDEADTIQIRNSGRNIVTAASHDSFSSNLGLVKLVKYEDEIVEIECRILEECLLMLTDTYFPGWKAFVDGKETEIFQADYLFRAVKLTPGKYVLAFRYDPPLYSYSKWISVIAFMAGLITVSFLLVAGRKK